MQSCNNDVNEENEDSQQARKHARKASKRKRDPVNSDEDVGGKKKSKTSSSQTSVKLPSAPLKLKPAEIKIADQHAADVVVPADCSFKPRPIFSKVSRLNSHDLKEASELYMYGLE